MLDFGVHNICGGALLDTGTIIVAVNVTDFDVGQLFEFSSELLVFDPSLAAWSPLPNLTEATRACRSLGPLHLEQIQLTEAALLVTKGNKRRAFYQVGRGMCVPIFGAPSQLAFK